MEEKDKDNKFGKSNEIFRECGRLGASSSKMESGGFEKIKSYMDTISKHMDIMNQKVITKK